MFDKLFTRPDQDDILHRGDVTPSVSFGLCHVKPRDVTIDCGLFSGKPHGPALYIMPQASAGKRMSPSIARYLIQIITSLCCLTALESTHIFRREDSLLLVREQYHLFQLAAGCGKGIPSSWHSSKTYMDMSLCNPSFLAKSLQASDQDDQEQLV
jgi:hypothetical protein